MTAVSITAGFFYFKKYIELHIAKFSKAIYNQLIQKLLLYKRIEQNHCQKGIAERNITMDTVIDKNSVVADTIHGPIAISSFEKDIIATTLFNRLHGIHQNSTAYMTFPTNRTKRVEHSFGTMYLCGNIFSNSICNASPDDNQNFFKEAKIKITEIITSIQECDNYTHKLGMLIKKAYKNYSDLSVKGGIYDRIMPGNIENEQQTMFVILFEAIRVSALLHDIGHPPFSHITEFALKNVYDRVLSEQISNETIDEFKEIMQDFFDTNQELHEQMGNSIAKTLLKDAIEDIDDTQAKDDSIYNRQLFRSIVSEIVLNILKEKDSFYQDLHSIISGTLDGDRLDYVSRDAINSGFSVGIIEYERLISSMKLVSTVVDQIQHFVFCPCTSVINTIEDFLLRRWNLYCNIIYHHHVVKTDFFLQQSIEDVAYAYLKNNEGKSAAEKKDDYHYILPYDISGLWKAIRPQPSPLEWGYSINQWDDAWLTAILKKEYFEKIINESSCLNKMLTELLTNKRRFVSIIKRKEEFGAIDKAVACEIVKVKNDILYAIQELKAKQMNHHKKSTIDIEGFLQNIDILLCKSQNYSQKGNLTDNDGFLLIFIRNKLLSFKPDCDILQDLISGAIAKQYGKECLVVFKTLKTGTNKALYIYKKYYTDPNEQLVHLSEVSDISRKLENSLNFNPFFFIYMDIDRVSSSQFDFAAEREKIGTYIAQEICSYIIHFINDI